MPKTIKITDASGAKVPATAADLLDMRQGLGAAAVDHAHTAAEVGAAPAVHTHAMLMTQSERDQLAGLSAALDAKIDSSKLGALSGVAELDSTGKLKSSQLPVSALVDVSATGMTLDAGVLTLTQDEGGADVTLNLNSFATDAELTAGLAGKAAVTHDHTTAQISDAGEAGRSLLKMATMPEIQYAVSADGLASVASVQNLLWRSALNLVRSSCGMARLNIVGDSRSAGAFSAPGAATLRTHSVAVLLVAALNMAGVSARADSFFCDAGTGSTTALTAYDPRIGPSFGSWSLYVGGSNSDALCGKMLTNSTDNTPLPFTPVNSFNQIDVWYFRSGASDAFTIDVGGAALKTITTGTNNAVNRVTVTTADGLTLANQTVNIRRTAGSAFIIGVECHDTTKPSVLVRSMTRPSWGLGNWVKSDTAFTSYKCILAVPCDLLVFDSITNDLSSGVSTYDTRFNTLKTLLFDNIKTEQGKVSPYALVEAAYVGSSNTSYATQETFQDVLKTKADTWGVPLISVKSKFGSYDVANSAGLYHTDVVHYLTRGMATAVSAISEKVFGV